MKVIIMVGPHKSGKSQEVRELISNLEPGKTHYVCSSNFFFLKNGEYNFDPTKLSEAHTITRRSYLHALHSKYDYIFVDDCNLKMGYRKFYIEKALYDGYKVEVRVRPNLENIPCDLKPGIYEAYFDRISLNRGGIVERLVSPALIPRKLPEPARSIWKETPEPVHEKREVSDENEITHLISKLSETLREKEDGKVTLLADGTLIYQVDGRQKRYKPVSDEVYFCRL